MSFSIRRKVHFTKDYIIKEVYGQRGMVIHNLDNKHMCYSGGSGYFSNKLFWLKEVYEEAQNSRG